jgi:hypothetical protein
MGFSDRHRRGGSNVGASVRGGIFDLNQSAARRQLVLSTLGFLPCRGRAPSERDKCQAKLDIMVDAFIRDGVSGSCRKKSR